MNTIDDLLAIARHLNFVDANEAETRLKIIDKILFEILGWTHDDIHVEQRVSEDGSVTFADYIVQTASTAFIVEAKKIGVAFDTSPTDRRLKLTQTNLQGAFGDAIIQARDYCRKLGIQFAVVTNGNQWITFPAIRTDKVSFASSYAIVFNSLESILKHDLAEFKDLLSRKAVVNSSLENTLLGYTEDQISERRLKNFFRSPNTSENKNPIFPLIESAITTAFSDTITDIAPDLFEKCYVNSPDRTKFDRRINMHIVKSQHLFSVQPIRPMQKKESNAFKEILSNAHKQAKPLAIVILGTVGAGKTTFLHYTRNVSASNVFKKTPGTIYPHWIRVDFLGYTNDESSVDYIYKAIKDYIIEDDFLSDYNNCISHAYKSEIIAIKKGPSFLIAANEDEFKKVVAQKLQQDYDNTKPYIDKLLSYTTSKTPVFLVIDNVDQLDEKTQSKIFTDCVALSQRLRLNLVIALRSSTYVEHRNSPAFNAFDFDPILIEPPKVESVLSKRFFLARNLINGESGEFIAENGASVKVENLSNIIDLVQSSVLGTEVGGLLEVLAAGDIRNALRMTREFLEHGYTKPGKAIQTYQKTGSYVLPRHEALRSILLGNQAVYSESFSLIGNPFDSRLDRTKLQMLRLFILSSLVQHSSEASFQYLEGTEIKKQLRTIGIGDREALKALEDLCKLRFVHTASHNQPDFNSSYYPSRLGGHIIRDLIFNFTFIENVMMDTFIADETTWDSLTKLGREIGNKSDDIVARLESRIERVKIFYNYMTNLYSEFVEESNKRALPKEWRFNPLDEGYNILDGNLIRAHDSAVKNYGSSKNNQRR